MRKAVLLFVLAGLQPVIWFLAWKFLLKNHNRINFSLLAIGCVILAVTFFYFGVRYTPSAFKREKESRSE